VLWKLAEWRFPESKAYTLQRVVNRKGLIWTIKWAQKDIDSSLQHPAFRRHSLTRDLFPNYGERNKFGSPSKRISSKFCVASTKTMIIEINANCSVVSYPPQFHWTLLMLCQGTLIGGTRTSNWFLTKLGRYRNEKKFEKFFLLEKRSTIRSQFV